MANDEMRQNWSDGATGWVENEALFDAVFAPATEAILAAAEFAPGQRVLDVGCGTGTLLAAAAAAGAEPVGIDISPAMASAASDRVRRATVLVGDAQTADLLAEAPGAPFDRVVSRFGVMFFADPTAAFVAIRRACRPGARLAFVCWRDWDANPMFTLGTSVLNDRLGQESAPETPGAPGPTAFADQRHLIDVLTGAGWAGVRADPLDFDCVYGTTDGNDSGSDGVEQRLATILATSTGRRARERLEPELGAAGWAALLDEVRAELRSSLDRGRVRFPAATWLVTAGNDGPG